MKFNTMTAAAALALVTPAMLAANPDAKLVVNGQIEMTTETEAPEHLDGLRTIRSGWTFRTEETQSLQMDDFDNPAMIYVDEARDAWYAKDGAADQSCASCHEDPESLEGLRAELPKWNEEAGKVYTAEMYVNECRTERMEAEPWGWDSQEMKNMTALISSVSRGMTVDVQIDGPVRETWERGKEIYYTRYGQLELACATCHEENYDMNIRADHLSQGHINGFPTYRLKQANLVSMHNRFNGCIRDTRGVPYEIGSEDFVALELYVASRGNGLSVEGPAVRN
ncbi:sulfur oxidation c-type cytochrome SoxA [Rhodosalinus sediminis]|uniref:SoxAX cytochrome complex subunit A n=1 Tax=Rhodosalinus sediminis TaxID=1940533 RepID=A0A3D9BQJ7_9RHOB|nr:sulfur oxidation c-type cytochrome SoxA [Rhodosalinus sediminis]REC55631.1 sulfur oxidation c-type cytochrome SoxA [Rhodosalinus sediminis]